MEADSRRNQLSSRLNRSEAQSIEGMESVVATVSGYHGSERFKLIKLISHAGANYVGALTKSTTHLVCWKFEGKKYNLARKFKTIIVNHRWVEDCIKQGKRLPERPYMLKSGQEIGPLLLDVPLVSKKHRVFSEQSYLSDESTKEETDMGCRGSGAAVWTDSFLLNEMLLPKGKNNCRSDKPKPKPVKKTSKKKHGSSDRYCIREPSLWVEYEESSSDSSIHSVRGKRKISKHEESSTQSSMRSMREKRKISMGISSSSLVTPSVKGRRLVKKSIGGVVLQSTLSDSDQEGHPIFRTGETSDYGFHRNGGITEGLEDIEEIEDTNHSVTLERVRKDECSDSENRSGEVKDSGHIEHVQRLPTPKELSCVICWTEYSSTRGVLPCGHRFCYSCIQNWADHMASIRKISTCPLCKASFMSITKMEDAATSDQKIYSQTIPSSRDIFLLTDRDRPSIAAQSSLVQACSECRSREPEDLLIKCHLCQIRCIHSYCLDPPLFPWTCIHCKDLQMLYNYNR